MMKSDASSIRGKLNQVKIKRKKQKNRKRQIKKKEEKNQKKKKNPKEIKNEKKKNLSPAVLDKICVFCLYPIPYFSTIRKEGQL